MGHMDIWNKLKGVDDWAKKTIKGGRLNGMTDIKPQWRYLRLTDEFGMCGIGWKYSVDKQWFEVGSDGQVAAFVNVSLYVKVNGEWSDPIPGNGGSMFVSKEKAGLHTSDEAIKMATTDAIGTAAKMLGLAADVYMGGDYDTKYSSQPIEPITQEQVDSINLLIEETSANREIFLKYFKVGSIDELPSTQYATAMKMLEAKRRKAA